MVFLMIFTRTSTLMIGGLPGGPHPPYHQRMFDYHSGMRGRWNPAATTDPIIHDGLGALANKMLQSLRVIGIGHPLWANMSRGLVEFVCVVE